MIAMREAGALAKRLSASTCEKQGIEEGQLGLHASRGPSPKSKPVELLLVDLGVDRTLKYRPEFPERFGCIQDARSFCRGFFTWYNALHRPSGSAYLTPETVHYGHAADVIAARQVVLLEAYASHPERFVKAAPRPPELGEAVSINKPEREAESEVLLH